MAFWSVRQPIPVASRPPTPSATQIAPTVTGAECLIGDWIETNGTFTLLAGNTKLQFSGNGSLTKFSTDGKVLVVYKNVVYAASSSLNRYEVINNGTFMLDYATDATTIRYSNPVTVGTATLKINGTVNTTAPLVASLTPETYTCQGNKLRLQGEQSVTELQRL